MKTAVGRQQKNKNPDNSRNQKDIFDNVLRAVIHAVNIPHISLVHNIPDGNHPVHLNADQLPLFGHLYVLALDLHGPDLLDKGGLGAFDRQAVPDEDRPVRDLDHAHLDTVKIMGDLPCLDQTRVNGQFLGLRDLYKLRLFGSRPGRLCDFYRFDSAEGFFLGPGRRTAGLFMGCGLLEPTAKNSASH